MSTASRGTSSALTSGKLRRVRTSDSAVLETILETERLLLEPLAVSHAALLFEGLQDERLYQYIPQEPPADVYELSDRFAKLSSRRSPDGKQLWLNWAVRLQGTGQYIGWMQATVNEDGTSSIAYFIFSDWQRKGFCIESLQRVIGYLYSELNAASVIAEIDTRNKSSINVIEALGFERIGFTPDADTFKGASSNEYKYSLARPCQM